MGKVTWRGWQKDASNVATPTGPLTTRDGKKIVVLTVPPPKKEVK